MTPSPDKGTRDAPVPTAKTLSSELEQGWRAHRSGARPASVMEMSEPDGDGRLVMNFGPQHPATHGTLRSIFTLEGETIVEANAGTGKTWTLCRIVVRLIAEENIPIERILAVTFTNAAANELSDRIRKALVEEKEKLELVATDSSLRLNRLRLAIASAILREVKYWFSI